MCKSGCTSNELEFWLFQMQRESATSSLVFCTEAESGLMDRMICETLANSPRLMSELKMQYLERFEVS
ncbi:DUF1133 family protein [Pectobacterium parmentieri]|uniref:DUF1133 family protein n=1 Tax=Pectobacterium parmentieri TaxID=1905730 RepID=UPI001D059C90